MGRHRLRRKTLGVGLVLCAVISASLYACSVPPLSEGVEEAGTVEASPPDATSPNDVDAPDRETGSHDATTGADAPSCFDGVKNGSEADLDCGGPCAKCSDGKSCNVARDCSSGVCVDERCASPTCADAVKNGSESDVDCGGSCAAESKCGEGRSCASATDCTSGVCTLETCQPATCTDGVRNGTETDVDCGGSCSACATGKTCQLTTDCVASVCSEGTCQVPKRVFVTSTSYNGNLGGLDGADAKCQGRANAAGLVGSFRAWLSDSTGSPLTRFTKVDAPYVLVDGTLIANGWASFASSAHLSPIDRTEDGTLLAPPIPPLPCYGIGGTPYRVVRTNTRENGTIANPAFHCHDFSGAPEEPVPGGSYTNGFGSSLKTNRDWTWNCTGPCHIEAPLYCVEQ